jgi:hypothetical protein
MDWHGPDTGESRVTRVPGAAEADSTEQSRPVRSQYVAGAARIRVWPWALSRSVEEEAATAAKQAARTEQRLRDRIALRRSPVDPDAVGMVVEGKTHVRFLRRLRCIASLVLTPELAR